MRPKLVSPSLCGQHKLGLTNLGRISWKICSYVGSIHPVEKVGVTNHPGAT